MFTGSFTLTQLIGVDLAHERVYLNRVLKWSLTSRQQQQLSNINEKHRPSLPAYQHSALVGINQAVQNQWHQVGNARDPSRQHDLQAWRSHWVLGLWLGWSEKWSRERHQLRTDSYSSISRWNLSQQRHFWGQTAGQQEIHNLIKVPKYCQGHGNCLGTLKIIGLASWTGIHKVPEWPKPCHCRISPGYLETEKHPLTWPNPALNYTHRTMCTNEMNHSFIG